MFQFGFSSSCEPVIDDNVTADSIKWYPCERILIGADDLLPVSDDLVYSTFAAATVSLRCVSTEKAIECAVANGAENIIAAECVHSDLVPGKYEGGMKTWECTRDLVDLITSLEVQWEGRRVLDLGCGTGLLGIIPLIKGSQLVFQDYNKEVLELVTRKNILLNVPNSCKEKVEVELYSGDWSSFLEVYKSCNPAIKFDVILSSETIYNVTNYKKLHDVILELLADNGVCYLAGKCVYFGVGGSMTAFRDFVVKKGLLNVETCWSQSEGVAREIFKITHKHGG